MVNLVDVKLAINKLIEEHFKTKVLSNLVSDNFKTPAFFTRVDDLGHTRNTRNLEDRLLFCVISYIPEEITSDLELYSIGEEIRSLLDMYLKVKDTFLEIQESKIEIVDDTLQVRFTLDFKYTNDYKEKYDSNYKVMEEISINTRKGD